MDKKEQVDKMINNYIEALEVMSDSGIFTQKDIRRNSDNRKFLEECAEDIEQICERMKGGE